VETIFVGGVFDGAAIVNYDELVEYQGVVV